MEMFGSETEGEISVADIPRNGGVANSVLPKYQISTGVVKITSRSVKSVRMFSTTACL